MRIQTIRKNILTQRKLRVQRTRKEKEIVSRKLRIKEVMKLRI